MLVPPADWVIDSDLKYGPLCPSCSVLAVNRVRHRAWHLAMVAHAEKYVPPPMYTRNVPLTSPWEHGHDLQPTLNMMGKAGHILDLNQLPNLQAVLTCFLLLLY